MPGGLTAQPWPRGRRNAILHGFSAVGWLSAKPELVDSLAYARYPGDILCDLTVAFHLWNIVCRAQFAHNVSAMPDHAAPMEVALRVLAGILNGVKPSPNDMYELLRIAPEGSDLPAEELACEIVQRVLKDHLDG